MSGSQFRARVDDDHGSVNVVLHRPDGSVAEVQVAKVGDELVVAVAGTWGHHVTPQGFLVVNVAPKVAEAPKGGAFG